MRLFFAFCAGALACLFIPQSQAGQPLDLPGFRRAAPVRTVVLPAQPAQSECAPDTIVITTRAHTLVHCRNDGSVKTYAVGVGREGFQWSGVEQVSRKVEWPDWIPPPEMLKRQPYLPRLMAGGPGNPLGARAIYLGDTLYRIHGTNMPETIGQDVSSGCIRLLNKDVLELYENVHIGTRVVVRR